MNLAADLAEAPLAEPDSVSVQRRGHGEDPAQSADGMWIAFTSGRAGNRENYVMAADGIVFAREERPGGSLSDLCAIPAEGGPVEQLTEDPAGDEAPCWAPF